MQSAKVAEQWLIDLNVASQSEGSALTSSLGNAQLSVHLSQSGCFDHVDCWYLDLYRRARAIDSIGEVPAGLNLLCQADPPNRQYDLAMLPSDRRGEAELLRDQAQSIFKRLRVGGYFWIAVDNPNDSWVRKQLEPLTGNIKAFRNDQAVAYRVRKEAELKKEKDFTCEFMFRDRDRLMRAFSRPGVFSHRRIDPGARHLINAMQPEAGFRVLDIGCGSGTISAAAASVDASIEVFSLDSHTRAIECTEKTAALNQIGNITTLLSDRGELPVDERFDLVLANPPYYANFRIAELFLKTAQRALRSGGQLLIVGKDRDWYEQRLPERFVDVSVRDVKGYVVGSGFKF